MADARSVYGSDVDTSVEDGDVDPLGTLISGEMGVVKAVVRRFKTPRGHYSRWPDYGYDLRAKIGSKTTIVARQRMEAEIAEEAAKDERVLSAKASITFVGAGEWKVEIKLQLANGPFTAVLSVDKVTIKLLQTFKG